MKTNNEYENLPDYLKKLINDARDNGTEVEVINLGKRKKKETTKPKDTLLSNIKKSYEVKRDRNDVLKDIDFDEIGKGIDANFEEIENTVVNILKERVKDRKDDEIFDMLQASYMKAIDKLGVEPEFAISIAVSKDGVVSLATANIDTKKQIVDLLKDMANELDKNDNVNCRSV